MNSTTKTVRSIALSVGLLAVSAATAGSAPTTVTDSSTFYAITTNETAGKITGEINTAMQAGVTLPVALDAPTGAASAGSQALSTVAADLVTGLATLNETGRTIIYQLAATSAAGVVASASKTVTFTVTAE